MGKFLGVDCGEARLGVAVTDDLGMLAHALETVAVKGAEGGIGRVAELARLRKATMVVVGLPRRLDGTDGPAAAKVRAFAVKLAAALPAGCGVRLWDERMTTAQAQRALHEGGRNTRESRAVIDQVAAQIILQSYVDAQVELAGGGEADEDTDW